MRTRLVGRSRFLRGKGVAPYTGNCCPRGVCSSSARAKRQQASGNLSRRRRTKIRSSGRTYRVPPPMHGGNRHVLNSLHPLHLAPPISLFITTTLHRQGLRVAFRHQISNLLQFYLHEEEGGEEKKRDTTPLFGDMIQARPVQLVQNRSLFSTVQFPPPPPLLAQVVGATAAPAVPVTHSQPMQHTSPPVAVRSAPPPPPPPTLSVVVTPPPPLPPPPPRMPATAIRPVHLHNPMERQAVALQAEKQNASVRQALALATTAAAGAAAAAPRAVPSSHLLSGPAAALASATGVGAGGVPAICATCGGAKVAAPFPVPRPLATTLATPHVTAPTKTSAENERELSTEEWGRVIWPWFHVVAGTFSPSPTPRERAIMQAMIEHQIELLPCHMCHTHATAYLRAHPLAPHMSNRCTLSRWMLNFHNHVNARLGRRAWTFEEMRIRFGLRTLEVC